MGFKPMGIPTQEDVNNNSSAGIKKEKQKIEVKIDRIIDKNSKTYEYKISASPVNKRGFSIPTHDGVMSLNSATIIGYSQNFVEAGFEKDDVVVCYGNWKNDIDEGIVFFANNICEEIPQNINALRKFLQGGRLPRIGKVVADRIISMFGEETFEILDSDHEKLALVSGIKEESTKIISDKWHEIRKVYELIAILSDHGVTEDIAKKSYRYFKEQEETTGEKVDVIKKIKEEPYELINIRGIGFKKADAIGLSLGHSPNSKKRVFACLTFCLEELIFSSGNTAIPANDWILKFHQEINFDIEKCKKCCQWMIEQGAVDFKKINILNKFGTRVLTDCVILKKTNNIETSIAKNLRRIMDNAPKLEGLAKEEVDYILANKMIGDEKIQADETQTMAIRTALTSGFSIITGGPGTGKTTTCKNIVKIYADVLRKSIYLASPTGKAAQRMGQQIGQGIEAQTIHRLLGAKGFFFEFNEYNKLPVGVYIIDESSMLDIFLMDALLKAIPDGSILILVGDKDQLPSVGAGAILRDLLQFKKFENNIAFLKVPHRFTQGSDINMNAQLINQGKTPSLNGTLENGDSFIFIKKNDDSNILEEIERVSKYLNEEKDVPYKDIQVLTPQKNRLVGVESLNMTLRPTFNPEIKKIKDQSKIPRFYEGDRIMQFENDYDLNIYNGDMGYISDYDEETESFKLNLSTENRSVSMAKHNYNQIGLAYAITVHKSQGSESPYVIIPISSNHSYTLNRNNIYTGITRAKEKVILIGKQMTLINSIAKIEQNLRVTMLPDELAKAFANFEN